MCSGEDRGYDNGEHFRTFSSPASGYSLGTFARGIQAYNSGRGQRHQLALCRTYCKQIDISKGGMYQLTLGVRPLQRGALVAPEGMFEL